MDIISLIVSLISGAIGGNVAGAALRNKVLERWEIPLPGFSEAESAARFFKPWESLHQAAGSISVLWWANFSAVEWEEES
jgi:hypothetical protein